MEIPRSPQYRTKDWASNSREDKMVDVYTKSVLTIIALALILLTAENFMHGASAQQSPCGSQLNPCYVTNFAIDGGYPLTVRIK